jgi:hypothetical protein
MQRIPHRKHWAAGTAFAKSTGFIFHQDAAASVLAAARTLAAISASDRFESRGQAAMATSL